MSEDIAYCVCRSSDDSGTMIGCDNCDEWYHLKCISMTEKRASTFLKFYCSKCRDRDPSLKNQLVKESKKYVIHTITSSEVTSKQGTVRKKSPSPQRSNKVARYEDDATPEQRNYEVKDNDDQDETCMDNFNENDEEFDDADDRDETLRIENELSEKNNRKSKPKSRPSRKKTNTKSSGKKRGSKSDSSEKNNRKRKLKSRSSRREANTIPVDNERTNEKTHRDREEEISEIDDGLGQFFQWMFEYEFLSWRGFVL